MMEVILILWIDVVLWQTARMNGVADDRLLRENIGSGEGVDKDAII